MTGWATVIVQVLLILFEVFAVMTAFPGPFTATLPLLTVATLLLEEVQVTVLFEALLGEIVAVIVALSPVFKEIVVLFNERLVGAIVFVVGFWFSALSGF